MDNNTIESDLQNESVTTDPLLGDLQFNPVTTSYHHKLNVSGHTIEQDRLIYSADRANSVSDFKIIMVNSCGSPERASISLVLIYLWNVYLIMTHV